MDLFTAIVRTTAQGFFALCLENGLLVLAESEQLALEKLQASLVSWAQALESAEITQSQPLAIKELHEFLTLDGTNPLDHAYNLHTLRLDATQEV